MSCLTIYSGTIFALAPSPCTPYMIVMQLKTDAFLELHYGFHITLRKLYWKKKKSHSTIFWLFSFTTGIVTMTLNIIWRAFFWQMHARFYLLWNSLKLPYAMRVALQRESGFFLRWCHVKLLLALTFLTGKSDSHPIIIRKWGQRFKLSTTYLEKGTGKKLD